VHGACRAWGFRGVWGVCMCSGCMWGCCLRGARGMCEHVYVYVLPEGAHPGPKQYKPPQCWVSNKKSQIEICPEGAHPGPKQHESP